MGLVSSSSSASTLTCRTHGYEFARYAPSDYCDISLYDTKGLVGNPTYAAKDNKGERVFDTVFEALKPGTNSDIRVCYYCNFGIVFSNGASSASLYCPYGYGHYVIAYKDVTWYRYNDVFGITVNADYVLNYDANGGSEVSPTTMTVANTTATLKVTSTMPTKSGYTFKGWAEQENYEEGDKLYQAGEEVVLTWSEDYGSVENPVSKTLYAVWEEDGSAPNAPDAPKREDLYGILRDFVEVECISEGEGLPHEAKTYNTWTGTVDGQHEASVGKPYQDENNTWKVDVTLYGKVYARMYSCEPIFGVGEAHIFVGTPKRKLPFWPTFIVRLWFEYLTFPVAV